MLLLLYPQTESGILWIMHVIRPRPRPRPHTQRFSCVQPTGHILYGIFLKFGMCIDMVEI